MINEKIENIKEKISKSNQDLDVNELLIIAGAIVNHIKKQVKLDQQRKNKPISNGIEGDFDNIGRNEKSIFKLKEKVKNLFIKYSYCLNMENIMLNNAIALLLANENDFEITSKNKDNFSFALFLNKDLLRIKIDFVNKTGEKIGEVQNTKLANFFEISEGALRNIRKKEPLKFECLYLGAFCKANNITKEDLEKLLKD